MVIASAGLLGAAFAQRAAGAEKQDPHAHHHHGGGNTYSALAAAAADCQQTGQLCVDHCLELLGQGDKSLAECARMVNQTMAICAALQRLANAGSKYVPRMATLALDVCRDCEAECKKHADKHAQCKACMDSCAACAKECKAVAA